ncbi:phosphoribosylformylglycinamidine synthase [Alistipes indistinctus]|uniref:Phosphoribosylformylglycinamidine synthase n=2 Tax=Alistipes indistinctus TaxID=626932 RepID=G5H8D2_9BACT|nr:phosphoribosylformylglycinamidine synthase [Alistipes indistinctus]EHB92327.1 phosphoribosylformylglycinamidine synthase [Alistipes indistinctus YIT 12060]UWN60363.1 phosphoribosylformylglycinamidine synthase [Alistipes indistinctus YIT 12060]
MILFFRKANIIYAVDARKSLPAADIAKLTWLFSEAKQLDAEVLNGIFIGPRREMITPWSTNAVEITQNMGLEGIARIEEFEVVKSEDAPYDPMLRRMYRSIDQDIFTIRKQPDPVIYIDDIAAYNQQEGLALSDEEMAYLNELSRRIGRKLTDSEVFGFSQVNSEHCRHKIFNGLFIVDGEEMPSTLFGLIKKTTKTNPGRVVSAYKDNCAFLQGPVVEQFAPASPDTADYYGIKDFESVISVKAETHNFPTTVEPFNGAATGTGGEIRDRIAGGKGAFPVAGTAVYMTAYPRLDGGREWEQFTTPREWLYQTPEDILIKASNGASDFGNKFGQPLICGSVQTFEHFENGKKFGFDKVIMQAGGVGYGRKQDSIKDEPQPGDKVVLLGGDNYRIGMGGGAVSSVATGEYAGAIELNAVQRSNPEMQKRAYNAIRAASEETENPIISIHDHGAGGHLNCLSELVEATGGRIDMENLPIGDPTLSAKEIVGNESQERMGFVVKEENIDKLRRIAERERSPFYVIGEATGDMQFTFVNNKTGDKPIDLKLEDMFGKAPRTVLNDRTVRESYAEPQYDAGKLVHYIENVLQLEAVAAKDWLTNKVDRSVTGRVAKQQTAGSVQLPLNDCAVVALDYQGQRGIATALGHAPVAALADPGKGSVLAITEALTNIVFAPIDGGLPSVSLSANWMWPCKNEGEDARLYAAVQAASDYALALGINIPTGKDSLSMTQKYKDGEQVYAPGTVIITSVGEVSDVKKVVSPALKHRRSQMIYVDMSRDGFRLGGSSFAQVVGSVGMDVPTVTSADYFTRAFGAVQQLVEEGKVLSGHDVSAGGLITALLEMTFADNRSGMDLSLAALAEKDLIKVLFSEKPAVVLQVENGSEVCENLKFDGIDAYVIGDVNQERRFTVTNAGVEFSLLIDQLRDTWFKTSYLLDRRQSGVQKASERFANYKNQELSYKFPETFTGKLSQWGLEASRRTPSGIKAAVIREQGSNSEREMAWCMHLAGMDVKDVHMTDLISGRETLEDVNMIVFVGGFANSDVLNSAKGWAGAFLYNERAKEALDRFYAREDTLSLGVCNGCQLMAELGLITPDHEQKPRMLHNDSHKFESCFVNVEVQPTGSVLFDSMAGSRLGIWVAHGEGKFRLPYEEERYRIPLKYAYDQYPGNPNGSDYAAAAIVSADGRHLAMMPHIERSLRPWNWAYYPEERAADEVSPWIEAFVNARKWIEQRRNK